jgi:hypothetical protein
MACLYDNHYGWSIDRDGRGEMAENMAVLVALGTLRSAVHRETSQTSAPAAGSRYARAADGEQGIR